MADGRQMYDTRIHKVVNGAEGRHLAEFRRLRASYLMIPRHTHVSRAMEIAERCWLAGGALRGRILWFILCAVLSMLSSAVCIYAIYMCVRIVAWHLPGSWSHLLCLCQVFYLRSFASTFTSSATSTARYPLCIHQLNL
jgi:hypothetical protein